MLGHEAIKFDSQSRLTVSPKIRDLRGVLSFDRVDEIGDNSYGLRFQCMGVDAIHSRLVAVEVTDPLLHVVGFLHGDEVEGDSVERPCRLHLKVLLEMIS